MIRLSRSGWPRTWAGIRYANVGGININDPDCNVTVGVMLGFASFPVVFCMYEIYIRRRKKMVFEAHGRGGLGLKSGPGLFGTEWPTTP